MSVRWPEMYSAVSEFQKYAVITLAMFVFGCTPANFFISPNPYDKSARPLTATGYIELDDISESSGIEKSDRYTDTYWTLNDSGDRARIFALHSSGKIIKPQSIGEYHGIEIEGATNEDWEDLALDGRGNMYIADFGNNLSIRDDLTIYVISEPDPKKTLKTQVLRKIRFRYPDQVEFPPDNFNFDAEALFWDGVYLNLLTKHRSDTLTKLYRFDQTDPATVNVLTLVDSFDVQGMVTAADVSNDGSLLAVLTYNYLWLFELSKKLGGRLLSGKKFRFPIMAGQCEGVCFAGENIIITNEERDIYTIPLTRIMEHPFTKK